MHSVISIPHSVVSIRSSPFLPLFRHEMQLRCIRTARSFLLPFFSLSFPSPARSPCASLSFNTLLLPTAHPKLDAPASPFYPTSLSSRSLFSRRFFSPSSATNVRTLLASPYQLFLICYTAIPSLLFSYQPGRTRIHILQAFMMAAAHLCEPACRATSLARLRQARPLRARVIPALSKLTLALSFSLRPRPHTVQGR